MMRPDAVIKIGGSLSRGEGLAELCREIGSLGRRYKLLVIPGGGEFADTVRQAYRKYSLNESSAHCMALLAMDQYGYLLNALLPGSVLIRAPEFPAPDAADPWDPETGGVSILLPSEWLIERDPLPHSWRVTSDSIAAWIAQYMHCRRLILLKDVDGLLEGSSVSIHETKIIPELTPGQLSAHNGGVDPYLGHVLQSVPVETWIINGRNPERLRELLESSRTLGTRILSAGEP